MKSKGWPRSKRRQDALELLGFSVLMFLFFFGLGNLYLWQWDRELDRDPPQAPTVDDRSGKIDRRSW